MTETIGHSGAWGIAAIVIVLISWIMYRWLAPRTWREWGSAGVVQAFIIALYAEMYGFPLTVYLLVRFFDLDGSDLSANLWSSLLGVGEVGMLISMLLGYTVAVTGIGIFLQGWRELHRAHQQGLLATNGLYGLVRHPQYTGLFLILFGEGIVHWPTLFSVSLFPIIVLAYSLLARHEERQVIERFGEEYRAYQQEVPRFIPRLSRLAKIIGRSSSGLGKTKKP